MALEITKDRVGDVLKAISILVKSEVLIGVPEINADRKSDDGDPITNAGIGYVMEFGSPELNIPARPTLIPGVKKIEDKAIPLLKKAGEKALEGDLTEIDKALHKIGILGQNSVRAEITNGDFQPLAERTLKARKRRGRTGEKPLLDTGQYRNANTYVVHEKGK